MLAASRKEKGDLRKVFDTLLLSKQYREFRTLFPELILRSDLEVLVRGMTKIKGAVRLDENVAVSHKEITTTAILLSHCKEADLDFAERRKAGQSIEDYLRAIVWDPNHDGEDFTATREYLWELATKVRIQSSEAQKVVDRGGIDFILGHLRADLFGGWDAVMRYDPSPNLLAGKWNGSRSDACAFNLALQTAEMALSVLFEVCRYRSGCEAVAQHTMALSAIGAMPLGKYIPATAAMLTFMAKEAQDGAIDTNQPMCTFMEAVTEANRKIGMIQQAAIDTVGRCLNGLDKRCNLRRAVEELLTKEPREFLRAIKAADGQVSSLKSQDSGVWPDNQFVQLESAHRQLCSMLRLENDFKSGGGKSYRSKYCMEGSFAQDMAASEDRDLDEDPTPFAQLKACSVCMKDGVVGEDLKYCSRCKSVLYCSTECQTADYETHKLECVDQNRSSAPTRVARATEAFADKFAQDIRAHDAKAKADEAAAAKAQTEADAKAIEDAEKPSRDLKDVELNMRDIMQEVETRHGHNMTAMFDFLDQDDMDAMRLGMKFGLPSTPGGAITVCQTAGSMMPMELLIGFYDEARQKREKRLETGEPIAMIMAQYKVDRETSLGHAPMADAYGSEVGECA